MTFAARQLAKLEARARGIRRGSADDVEAQFRTLRRNGPATASVMDGVDPGEGIAGKHQVSPDLNGDSARFPRPDRWVEADPLEDASALPEESVEMAELVTLLRHLPDDVTEAYMNGRLPARPDYPMLWHLTAVLAQRTTESRGQRRGEEDAASAGGEQPGNGSGGVRRTVRGEEVTFPRRLVSGPGLGIPESTAAMRSDAAAGRLLSDAVAGFRLTEQTDAEPLDPFAATMEPVVIPAGAARTPARVRREVATPLPVVG